MKSKASSALITLMQLHPLVPPRFPRLSELLSAPNSSEPSSPKRQGLFSSLIGSPEVLLDDLVRRPEHYETGVAELLQELVTGQKTLAGLSDSETLLLDHATLDWNRSSSAKPPETQKTAALKTISDESSSSFYEDAGDTAEETDDVIPNDPLIPEWFR